MGTKDGYHGKGESNGLYIGTSMSWGHEDKDYEMECDRWSGLVRENRYV